MKLGLRGRRMKLGLLSWREVVADPNCDHEVDIDGPSENFDLLEMGAYRAAGFHCRCKKCMGSGYCVDDTGSFWLDEEGNYL